MGRITTVLFDLDGTLQQGDKVDVINRMWDLSNELGLGVYDVELIDVVRRTSDFREMVSDLCSLGFQRGSHATVNEAIEWHKTNISGRYDHLIRPFPETREVLQQLRDEGYSLGLVTTRGSNSLRRLLQSHGIGDFFGSIVSRDDCKERKPNPAPLNLALQRFGTEYSADRAVYVGDLQTDDIGAAKNAGMIGILKGPNPPIAGNGLHIPDYHIITLRELPGVLRSIV